MSLSECLIDCKSDEYADNIAPDTLTTALAIEAASDSEAAWPWRSRTASSERANCLVCDEPLGQHAFRYCSRACGDAAHEKARRLFGELLLDPPGDAGDG